MLNFWSIIASCLAAVELLPRMLVLMRTIAYIRGGSTRISEGECLHMNGWLAKKSNNWLMQLAIVCNMLYLGGSGGMPPQKNLANLAYSVLNLVIFLTEK